MPNLSNSAPISVIIPCYRCCATIGRAVDSVFKQSLRPKEIILVDDYSCDGTLAFLNELNRKFGGELIVLALVENGGAASGLILIARPASL